MIFLKILKKIFVVAKVLEICYLLIGDVESVIIINIKLINFINMEFIIGNKLGGGGGNSMYTFIYII